MIRRYITFFKYDSFKNDLFYDVFQLDNVYNYGVTSPKKSKFASAVRKLHTSYKINEHIVHLPGQQIWYRDFLTHMSNDTCVLVDTEAMPKLDRHLLESVKRKYPKSKFVPVVLDSIHAHSVHMLIAKKRILTYPWDLVLSYDTFDCQEYGFRNIGLCYYSKRMDLLQDGVSSQPSDLYFVGRNKANRNQLALTINQKSHSEGVDCHFDLVGMGDIPTEEGLFFHQKDISYQQVLRNVMASNCILEILQPGQNMQTIRYHEAVCYNKKLLTNNERVKELPFYNPDYMKVFKTVDDIDWEWLKRRAPIDYHYNGEFSPVRILKQIEEYFA